MPRKAQFYILSFVLLSLSYYLLFTYFYKIFTSFTFSILPDFDKIENEKFVKVLLDWRNTYFDFTNDSIEVYLFSNQLYGDYVVNFSVNKSLFNFSCSEILIANSEPILPGRIYHIGVYDNVSYDYLNGVEETYDTVCFTKCFVYINNSEEVLSPIGNSNFYFITAVKPVENGPILAFDQYDGLFYRDGMYILNLSGSVLSLKASGHWDLIIVYFNRNSNLATFIVNFKKLNATVFSNSFLLNNVHLFGYSSSRFEGMLEFLELAIYNGTLNFSYYAPLPFNCTEDDYSLNLSVLFPFTGKTVNTLKIYGGYIGGKLEISTSYSQCPSYAYLINYNRPFLREMEDYVFKNGTFYFNISNPYMEIQVSRDFIIS